MLRVVWNTEECPYLQWPGEKKWQMTFNPDTHMGYRWISALQIWWRSELTKTQDKIFMTRMVKYMEIPAQGWVAVKIYTENRKLGILKPNQTKTEKGVMWFQKSRICPHLQHGMRISPLNSSKRYSKSGKSVLSREKRVVIYTEFFWINSCWRDGISLDHKRDGEGPSVNMEKQKCRQNVMGHNMLQVHSRIIERQRYREMIVTSETTQQISWKARNGWKLT